MMQKRKKKKKGIDKHLSERIITNKVANFQIIRKRKWKKYIAFKPSVANATKLFCKLIYSNL